MPIENEVIWEYSNGELVKSETLGVWKTHDGMDIAASVGTDVKAACTGKVKEINVGTWIIGLLFTIMFFVAR